MDEVWAHPQLAARGRWTEVGTPVGPVPALLPPAAHDGVDARMDAVPALGEHTEAILAELGFDATAIARLRATARSDSPSATTMPPALVFACAHLCDERLFAAQIDALGDASTAASSFSASTIRSPRMAEALLAAAPERFTLIGLSLGGYVAFEVMRRAPQRVERLVLLDTTAAADSETRRAGRLADIATVEAGGIEALIPRAARALAAAGAPRARRPARAHGDMAQERRRRRPAQPAARDARSARNRSPTCAAVRVPTLVACGADDAVTPVADHEAIAARIAGARFESIADCGHLSTIEQPAAVTPRCSPGWLAATPSP